MIIGVFLITGGILIAIYPKLLSIIVASLLIFLGTFAILASLQFRRIGSNKDVSLFRFIFRL